MRAGARLSKTGAIAGVWAASSFVVLVGFIGLILSAATWAGSGGFLAFAFLLPSMAISLGPLIAVLLLIALPLGTFAGAALGSLLERLESRGKGRRWWLPVASAIVGAAVALPAGLPMFAVIPLPAVAMVGALVGAATAWIALRRRKTRLAEPPGRAAVQPIDRSSRLVVGSATLALSSGIVLGIMLGALAAIASHRADGQSFAFALSGAYLGVAWIGPWVIPPSLLLCAVTATCAALVSSVAGGDRRERSSRYVLVFAAGTTAIALGGAATFGMGYAAAEVWVAGGALIAGMTSGLSWLTVRLVEGSLRPSTA